MDWLINKQQNNARQISLLKKMTRISVYDNNEVFEIDELNLRFNSILNCKKINREYQIIGKVEGQLDIRVVQISCGLVSYGKVVVGKWQYQKVQLCKFAYRYNQKSMRVSDGRNRQGNLYYQMKVNPLSGEFYVCCQMMIGDELIEDYERLQLKLTDECRRLTTSSQILFTQILSTIFGRQITDSYKKSQQKSSSGIQTRTKLPELLSKIKKMDMTSSYYKIKSDISNQNKYRSAFKKVFVKKYQKCLVNGFVANNALGYQSKFCKKYWDAVGELGNKKKVQFIAQFEELDDSLEVELARKYLQDFSKPRTGQSIIQLNNLSAEQKAVLSGVGVHNMGGYLVQVEVIGKEKKIYQYELINKLNFKYLHMAQYFHIKGEQFINLRITQYIEEMPLTLYLQRNAQSLSLSSKLQMLIEICHTVQVLHKMNIGYFIQINNIYMVDGLIKIKDFTSGYSLCNWDEVKQKEKDFLDKKYLMSNYKQYLLVCGYVKIQENQMKDRMEEEKEKDKSKFENQRADIFSLGMVLYRILMGKFPFELNSVSILQYNFKKIQEMFEEIWTVQTEYFLRQGGMIVKLLGHLLLKCLYFQVDKRPYVQWITVILSQVKAALE